MTAERQSGGAAVAPGSFGHQELQVGGMDCADCARTIERAVGRIGGVTHAEASFAGARVRYEYETGKVETKRVADRIRSLGSRSRFPGTRSRQSTRRGGVAGQAGRSSAPSCWRSRCRSTSSAGRDGSRSDCLSRR